MTEDTHIQLERLLANVRSQFYTDVPAKKWFKDMPAMQRAVTWPATWLKHRGITWSADRYFREIREKLQEVKRHGATGEIEYFPGYLLKVLQDHFAHNSDRIRDEGRQARNAFDIALGRAQNAAQLAATRAAEQTVDVLAEAHRVLAGRKRSSRARQEPCSQGLLFDA